MITFKNILYICQGLDSDNAPLDEARALAAANNAQLHILVVYAGLPAAMESHRTHYEDALTAPLRALVGPDVPVTVESGRALGNRILQRVVAGGHDLVITDAGTPESGKGFHAMEMALLRKSPCPVWLMRAPFQPTTHIGVAIEPESDEAAGRALSLQLLRLAATLSQNSNVKLTVISCWDYPFENYLRNNALAPVTDADINSYIAQTEREQRESLDKVFADSGVQANFAVEFRRGHPSAVIPAVVAERGINLMVMGTLARTGIPGFTIGNTAESVLQKLACDLLALKPEGFISPVKP